MRHELSIANVGRRIVGKKTGSPPKVGFRKRLKNFGHNVKADGTRQKDWLTGSTRSIGDRHEASGALSSGRSFHEKLSGKKKEVEQQLSSKAEVLYFDAVKAVESVRRFRKRKKKVDKVKELSRFEFNEGDDERRKGGRIAAGVGVVGTGALIGRQAAKGGNAREAELQKLRSANPEFKIKSSGDVRIKKDKYGLPKSKSQPAQLRRKADPAPPKKVKDFKEKTYKPPVGQDGKPIRANLKEAREHKAAWEAKQKKRKAKHAKKVSANKAAQKAHAEKIKKMPRKSVKLDYDKAGNLLKRQEGVRKRLRKKFWKGALKVL